MEKPKLDRNYHLFKEDDRDLFISKFESSINSKVSTNDFNIIINFLSKELGEEWVTVNSMGLVNLKIREKGSKGVNFFDDFLSFGKNLIELKDVDGFNNLLMKLHIPILIESTILEINSAARYKMNGYVIELEPAINDGKHADFRVNFMGEWIYFECKKEHMEESKYYKNYNDYTNEIMNKLNEKHKDDLNDKHRIDIIMHKKLPKKHLTRFYKEVKSAIKNKRYGKWIGFEEIEFAINERMDYIDLQPQPVKVAIAIVPDKPIRLSDENFLIRIFFDPFGNKELQKIRRILKEAKNQIPKSGRGIIILEVNHTEKMVDIVQEKINQRGYEHIIAVLVVGNGAWSVPNIIHQNFPRDFFKIAVVDTDAHTDNHPLK